MHNLTYLAVFEPSGDGYGVYFPDLPGCISWGDSFPTAKTAAQEALALHLYGMEQDGETTRNGPRDSPPCSNVPLRTKLVDPSDFLMA